MSPHISSPNDLRVTMMLCDHVQEAGGKLFISGGGWSQIAPQAGPTGLAILVSVPWTMANERISFTVALVQADGEPVHQVGPLGPQAVEISGEFEVGRPPGSVQGAPIEVPLALNFPPLALPVGTRLTWRLEMSGAGASISDGVGFTVST